MRARRCMGWVQADADGQYPSTIVSILTRFVATAHERPVSPLVVRAGRLVLGCGEQVPSGTGCHLLGGQSACANDECLLPSIARWKVSATNRPPRMAAVPRPSQRRLGIDVAAKASWNASGAR